MAAGPYHLDAEIFHEPVKFFVLRWVGRVRGGGNIALSISAPRTGSVWYLLSHAPRQAPQCPRPCGDNEKLLCKSESLKQGTNFSRIIDIAAALEAEDGCVPRSPCCHDLKNTNLLRMSMQSNTNLSPAHRLQVGYPRLQSLCGERAAIQGAAPPWS